MIGLRRLALWWRNRSIDAAHRWHRMRQPEAYVDIDDVVTRFRGSGGLKHRFQAYKLFELNQLLERHRPATILELGSGSSTAIFASFVKQGEGRHLTSVDESGKWLANARSLAGIDADDTRFTWLESQPRARQDASGVRIGYGISPAPYDLVFVDGPSLKLDGVQRKDAVNDDVYGLFGDHPPQVVVVDARYATVQAIADATRGQYEFMPSDLLSRFPSNGYRYFSVFVRREAAGLK